MAMEIFKLLGTVAISKDKALKDIKAIQTQAEKTSTAMGKSFTKFSGYVEKHSAQIKKAGKYLTVFGGIATAAFAVSVKSAANFEEQLANVSTMLNESAMKILPEYRKGLQSLSIDFGESTETLSKGLYDILSASIPPAEALGVLEISAKAAAAGITDTGVAADAITTILNSYGMSADQAGIVSDKLFAIVKEGKTTFADLAPSIGKVAATASMAGLDFDDLGASIATLTRAGIRTEETMTAINGVLRAFLTPEKDATEAAKKFGLVLNTNTLRTEGLTGVMEKLKDATAEELAAIFGNIRGLKGMAAALGDAEGYARSYALMLDSAGLTQEAFEKQSNTLNFALKQLKSMFEVLKVTIGDTLAPAVKDITEKVMEALKGFKEWTEANKPLTETIVKWAAGLSVALLVLGPLLIILPGLIASLGLLKIAFVPFLIGGLIIAGLIKMSELFGDIKKRAFEMHTGFKEWPLDVLITKISEMKNTIAGLEAELEEIDKPIKLFGIELKKQDPNIGRLTQVIKDYKIQLGLLEEELKILIETLGITGTGIKQVDEFAQSFADKMLMMEIAAKSFVVANKNLRTFMEPVRKIIEGIIAALTPYEQKIIAVNAKYDEMIETIKESGAAEEEITAAIEDANIARDGTLKLLADEKTAYDKLVEIQKTAKDIMAGIVDKIFEFTRSPYDVKLRDINREYDGYIEKIKAAKLGAEEQKIAIDEINVARDLDIQNLKAGIDATKGLSLEMKILTAEYKLSEQAAEDTIKYYQDMLEAAEKIVEVKKAERDALEEGTEEWKEANLAYLEAQIVTKDYKEILDELNRVKTQELEGLELVRAKLDLQSAQYRVIAKDADYYKDRIEWLGEEHGILAEKIVELKDKGDEWTDELVKITKELYANEEASDATKKELIELAKGMSATELEASGLVPVLNLLGVSVEDLGEAAKTTWEKWEDFFDNMRENAQTTTEILQDAAIRWATAVGGAFENAITSLLNWKEINEQVQADLAANEEARLDEVAEYNENYKEKLIGMLKEIVDANILKNATIEELEALMMTHLKEEWTLMSTDAIDDLQDIDDKYDELKTEIEEKQVTLASIWKDFWEELSRVAIAELAKVIAQQAISVLLSWGPAGWALLGLLFIYSLIQSGGKALGGEVAKQAKALGGEFAYALGGLVKGLQLGGGTDTVLIRATPGEYVVSKSMTNFIKRTGIVTSDLINAIRMGARTPTPSFAVGGAVPSVISNPISNQVNIEEISVSIFAQTLDDETIANAGDKIFVELKRQFDMRGLVLMEG